MNLPLTFLILLPSVWLVAEPADTPPPSTVVTECRYLTGEMPVIDGLADEALWEKAVVLDKFRVLRTQGDPVARPTAVRLLWNDTHLFVTFDCVNDGIRSDVLDRDGPVWEGEAAELFLCPQGPDAFYYEINFTPHNVIFDSRVESWKYKDMARDGMKWAENYHARIRSATHVRRDPKGQVTGWSVEAAIPFADLDVAGNKPPAPGQQWFFNVFRIAVKADKAIEYGMWQPVHPEFHRPHQFPQLRFVR